MKTIRLKQAYPHRFLTKEHALAFQKSGCTLKELIVPVFEMLNGKPKVRQQWLDAPFELNIIGEVSDDESPPVNFEFHEYAK